MGNLPDVVATTPFSLVLGQAAQDAVGSGAGKWWLLVAALGAATLICGVLWLATKRRTMPPAKQRYVPPPLPTRSNAGAGPSRR